jgi:hypothetical protein
MKPLKIEIAGVCAKIVCQDKEFVLGIEEQYRDFQSTAEEDLVFYVDSEVQPSLVPDAPKGLDYGEQNVLLIPGKWKYSVVLGEDRHIKLGFIDITGAKVQLHLLPGLETGSYFHHVFMHAIRHFLTYQGGLLLHASALVREGKGFVFCGPDEGGKSTIANMAPASLIAADDSLAVRKVNGSSWLHTVPWGRRDSQNVSAPIAKLFFLHKARDLEVKEMALIEAVKQFLANTFFDTSDELIYARTLETVHSLAERVSCYELYFPLTGDYMDALLSS